MYDYYNYSYFSPFHFLFTLVGWVIVFMIIVWVIRAVRGKGHHVRGHNLFRDPGMDTLRERYAKGEIDKKEFEERKRDLMS